MTDGPKLNVHLGVTLPIPGVDYGMIKPDIEIRDIDLNGDVEAQVTLALEQAAYVMSRVDEQLEVSIVEMLTPESGKPGYRERLEETERSVSALKKRVNDIVVKLREHNQVMVELATGARSGELEPPVEEEPVGS